MGAHLPPYQMLVRDLDRDLVSTVSLQKTLVCAAVSKSQDQLAGPPGGVCGLLTVKGASGTRRRWCKRIYENESNQSSFQVLKV